MRFPEYFESMRLFSEIRQKKSATVPTQNSLIILIETKPFQFVLSFLVLSYFCRNGRNQIYHACHASRKVILNVNWWLFLVWHMNTDTAISTFYPSECNTSNEWRKNCNQHKYKLIYFFAEVKFT